MPVLPLHGGPLHGVEWLLSLVLIIGPLVALGVTILAVRRREEREAVEAARLAADLPRPIHTDPQGSA